MSEFHYEIHKAVQKVFVFHPEGTIALPLMDVPIECLLRSNEQLSQRDILTHVSAWAIKNGFTKGIQVDKPTAWLFKKGKQQTLALVKESDCYFISIYVGRIRCKWKPILPFVVDLVQIR